MKLYVYLFLVTSIVFLIIDGLWLGFIAKPFYEKYIGGLLKPVNLLPAIIFYVIYVVGMIVFVINPNLSNFDLLKTLATGFFFGVICYATYDLTNMATIKGWVWSITIVDIIWGGKVTMVTTTLVTYLFRGV